MPKPPPDAYEKALSLLEYRARSEAELRNRLRRAGFGSSDVEVAIARLREQKFLDDADFARQFARTRLGTGSSRRRIVLELGRKGIDRGAAEAAVAEVIEDEGIDPASAAHHLAARKWSSLQKLDDATRRRRLYAFLARRGFDPDEIRSAMTELGADSAG